ncbi:MAG TPA: META domain-containing protein [Saprospiraceae bacterium]|nr:META domain-containing protein [Saprospiraceae bacterium]HMQ81274.1 META domain-containing protein [Saprospiraceae bacterium]
MRIVVTLVFFVLIAACGNHPNPAQEQSTTADVAPAPNEAGNAATPDTVRFPDLEKKNWELISYELDGEAFDIVRDSKVRIQFLGNQLSGNSGCNTFQAGVAIGQDGTLKVDPIAQTKMICQGVMRQENNITALLQQAQTYSVNRIFLEIGAANGKMTFALPQ